MLLRQFILILPLLLGTFTLVSADSSDSITITGGTDQERSAIQFIVQHDLDPITDSSQDLSVKLVNLDGLHADVVASEGNDPSLNAGKDADEIDGLYQDDPPTITLLSGEAIDELKMTFAHEFGHHVWTFLMNGNDHAQFTYIYAKQLAANQLISSYAKESAEEGFAEDFSYYLLQPQKLKSKDTASYNDLRKLLNRLKLEHKQHLNNGIQTTLPPHTIFNVSAG